MTTPDTLNGWRPPGCSAARWPCPPRGRGSGRRPGRAEGAVLFHQEVVTEQERVEADLRRERLETDTDPEISDRVTHPLKNHREPTS